eukprot:TRINITY_DN18670_c0_g1_i1.p1 TRINITY_DN18670_c0_g1~~TRINITY_DN18670_c0_g1_i1.p1  ORF type:complete len:1021 (+),score=350.25 TRINITY_DN18670_c0_g1_i1:76-3138(+)
MTIIVFLVDTSGSMNQRAFVNGKKTLLDISKEAVEVFVKQRQKSAESRGDRYMLLTFDEFPRNIKAGWKENLATFMTELKNLEAAGMTTMGSALKAVFDTLNINRMQSGIDMYGQGRYPYYLEPAVIVVVTDGGKLTTLNTVQRELNLPMTAGAVGGMSGVPGAEMTREPFRWDQRLYALVLRMAGHPPMSGAGGESGHVASDHSPIDAMCEVTGGRSYAVTSNRVLHQCIESLVQKLQSGVVIHFEKIGSDPPLLPDTDMVEVVGDITKEVETVAGKFVAGGLVSVAGGGGGSRPHTPNAGQVAGGNTAWHSCRKLIYVQRSAQKGFAVGFWPLPEAFWPDVSAHTLPQRSAHPTLKFTCTNQEPMVIENLPFDKYELEPSPLTLFILGRKQPNFCWQVFIQGSTKNGDTGHPFGYLKASTNLLTVNLFVLPYNYPMLLPLLDDLFKAHRLKPTNEWRTQFHNYLRTMPTYYAGPLRRALSRMGAGNLASTLIPEAMDNSLSYSVLNYLKRLKNQAKLEYDRIVSVTPYKGKVGPDGIKVNVRSQLKRELMDSLPGSSLRDQVTDFPGYMLGLPEKAGAETHPLRNPFDIPRHRLLDQLVRMRANLIGRGRGRSATQLVDSDTRHSLPIGQMGNYQDYLKKQPLPLRELESQPVRQHMFGNPFKINKNLMMTDEVSGIVDEVQLVGVSGPQGAAGRGIKRSAEQGGVGLLHPAPPKRRKGALPKDFQFVSPSSSPSHSIEHYPSPPPSPSIPTLPPLVSPTPPPTIQHTYVPPPSLPCPPMSNGVGIPGLGPVYPSGKMAAFRSLCDSDLDSDGEAPLVILEQVEPGKRDMEEEEDEDDEEDEIQQVKVINHIKSGTIEEDLTCLSNSAVAGMEATSRDKVNNMQNELVIRSTANGDNGVCEGRASPPPSSLPSSPSPDPAPECSSPTPSLGEPSEEELRSIKLRNNNVRQLIYKEVKKPGRGHTELWDMLATLHGPPTVRRQFIQEVRQEAVRFKRLRLAEQLQKRSDSMSCVEEAER